MIIMLKDCLQQMEDRDPATGKMIPFDFSVCTFSRQRMDGGKIIEYKGAVLAKNTDTKKSSAAKQEQEEETTIPDKRNPKHFLNKTRNILLPGQERPTKFRIRYIIDFNKQTIVY